MANTAVVPEWKSITTDFETTTGKSLELEFENGPDGWMGFRVSIDQVFIGSFGTIYPGGNVERLVQLANDLTAGFLGEVVGAGWPMCPVHATHPLNATVDGSHRAVWKCPSGRVVAEIGELTA